MHLFFIQSLIFLEAPDNLINNIGITTSARTELYIIVIAVINPKCWIGGIGEMISTKNPHTVVKAEMNNAEPVLLIVRWIAMSVLYFLLSSRNRSIIWIA